MPRRVPMPKLMTGSVLLSVTSSPVASSKDTRP
jgi:hypothetical protein